MKAADCGEPVARKFIVCAVVVFEKNLSWQIPESLEQTCGMLILETALNGINDVEQLNYNFMLPH